MDSNRESQQQSQSSQLRMMQEKDLEKRQHQHMIYVDLGKAYDRVPRSIIWWALRKKNVGEEYVNVIQAGFYWIAAQNVMRKTKCDIGGVLRCTRPAHHMIVCHTISRTMSAK